MFFFRFLSDNPYRIEYRNCSGTIFIESFKISNYIYTRAVDINVNSMIRKIAILIDTLNKFQDRIANKALVKISEINKKYFLLTEVHVHNVHAR
jgi:hypothetical protein